MLSDPRRDSQVRNSPGWKMPSKMPLLRSLHGFSIPNFSMVSIRRRPFLHNHLLAASSLWHESSFESRRSWFVNKHRKWFHSSRVKFSLVKMSASWVLEYRYLIWILGSESILSTNQSRATLWVLEACLSVGLLPLMIILIIASLSSKMCNTDPLWEEVTFEETKSTLDNSRCLWETGVFESSLASRMLYHVTDFRVRACLSVFDLNLNALHQKPNPRDQPREYRPCGGLHREK